MISNRRLVPVLLVLLALGAEPLRAQEAAAPAPAPPAAAPSFEEAQAMIARMQQRLDRLGSAASERDQALRFLEQQVDQAAGEIAGTGKTNESLRGETAALSDQLEGLSRDRDRLTSEADQRRTALERLEAQVAALTGDLGRERYAKSGLTQELEGVRAELAAALAQEGQLRARLAVLEQGATASADAAAARVAAAEAEAATRAEDARRVRQEAADLRRELDDARELLAVAESEAPARAEEARRLREEASGLRRQIDEAHKLLAAAETEVDEKQDAIDALDERLAEALAQRVEELEQYRSEFFGRLRQALGDRPDLRIVGDRFVFQSELLFESGSASLDPAGQGQLRELARTLEEVAARIPPEVDWVLRVDGHTDRQPIRDGSFRSNWELSVARAISVIDFLTRQGIPPEHLAAAGFGEYRPIDPRDDEVAYRRNRRIEFKLTEG
jgi:chemotaxis protein MotB